MTTRRKFFALLAGVPIAAVVGVKAAAARPTPPQVMETCRALMRKGLPAMANAYYQRYEAKPFNVPDVRGAWRLTLRAPAGPAVERSS